MAKISQTFLVTIQIDSEKAQPFPEGFKDPSKNNGSNGMNWKTYPNWELNFQDREHEFVNSVCMEFQRWFQYDGLKCRIAAVDSEDFKN